MPAASAATLRMLDALAKPAPPRLAFNRRTADCSIFVPIWRAAWPTWNSASRWSGPTQPARAGRKTPAPHKDVRRIRNDRQAARPAVLPGARAREITHCSAAATRPVDDNARRLQQTMHRLPCACRAGYRLRQAACRCGYRKLPVVDTRQPHQQGVDCDYRNDWHKAQKRITPAAISGLVIRVLLGSSRLVENRPFVDRDPARYPVDKNCPWNRCAAAQGATSPISARGWPLCIRQAPTVHLVCCKGGGKFARQCCRSRPLEATASLQMMPPPSHRHIRRKSTRSADRCLPRATSLHSSARWADELEQGLIPKRSAAPARPRA